MRKKSKKVDKRVAKEYNGDIRCIPETSGMHKKHTRSAPPITTNERKERK